MRILLKLVLDCPPDAAWNAIRSPATFAQVSAPFTTFESLEPQGFPERWPAGAHPVRVRAFGVLPIGEQSITISFPTRHDDVRVMRDDGGALDGPLAVVTEWHHTMAVSPAPHGRTLYRDRLQFSAGVFTVVLWPVYWAFWQWRAVRMRRLATTWV